MAHVPFALTDGTSFNDSFLRKYSQPRERKADGTAVAVGVWILTGLQVQVGAV